MNFISDLFSEQILHALGWTLVHSIWQGGLIALLTGFLLLGFRKRSARVRYALIVGSLGGIFLLSAFTFIHYYSDYQNVNQVVTPSVIETRAENIQADVVVTGNTDSKDLARQTSLTDLYKKFTGYFHMHFPILITIWFMGILFFLLKLLGGLIYSEKIKHSGTKPFPEYWNNKITELRLKMNIVRPVRIVESFFARVPMVIGYFRPVILVPVGLLSGIPGDQVEAIIAHELAHIRRNDFLINIFQSVIEAIFFFNPAVWWISGMIRKEREHCCDDIAVSVCDETLVYAKALANLQERSIGAPYYAVAFAGKNHSLLSRIKRISQKPMVKNNLGERWISFISLIMVLLTISVMLRFSGINDAEAATIPVEEVSMDILNLDSSKILSEFKGTVVQDTIKKPSPRTIRTEFFDASDQKDKEVKMVLEGDKVVELYIDGEKIPEEEYYQYQELIDNTLAELKEAEKELEMARVELEKVEKSLAEIDLSQIEKELELARKDVEKAMQQMEEFDRGAFSREMERAKEEFKRAMDQMKEFDMQQFKEQYRQMEEEFRNSKKHFNEQDWKEHQQEFEEARKMIEEAMKGIDMKAMEEEFRMMQLEMENIWQEFDTSEINREIRNSLHEMDRAMEQFNQQHIHELEREMEKIKQAIHQSMQEIHQQYGKAREEYRDSIKRERRELEYEEQRRQQQEEITRQREETRRAMDTERRVREEEMRSRELSEEREKRTAVREENIGMNAIREQLVMDGFYKNGDPVDFELSTKKLKIDGKKQSKELFEKYKQLYEEKSGSLPETGSIIIKH